MDYRSSGTSRDVNESERDANDAYVCGLAMYERLEQPYLNLSNPRAALTGPGKCGLEGPSSESEKPSDVADQGGTVRARRSSVNEIDSLQRCQGFKRGARAQAD